MPKGKQQNEGAVWLKRETGAYRCRVALLCALGIVSSAASLFFAYFIGDFLNGAIDGNSKIVWIFLGVLVGLLLIKIGLKVWENYYEEALRVKLVVALRNRVFSGLLRADYTAVSAYHSGELLHRVTTDINEVASSTVRFFPAFLSACAQVVGAVVILLTIQPIFTAVYVLGGAVFAAVAVLFRKSLKERQKEVLAADGAQRSFFLENIRVLPTVKAYSAERESETKMDGLGQELLQKSQKRNAVRTGMGGIFSLLGNVGFLFAAVWYAVGFLRGNPVNIGSVLSVVLLLMQFQQPLTRLSGLVPAYYARIAAAERLAEIDVFPKEEDGEDECFAAEDFAELSAENLAFAYGRGEVLHDVSFRIRKGEIVCLTGGSGAGKSTLLKLLLAILQPTDGRHFVSGQKGNRLPVSKATRGLFAYVPQQNFLLFGTIYENLTFFASKTRKNADDFLENKVKAALTVACAEFVYDLPNGLQTVLGEGGSGLSEGQLQRLSVARALLSDRPVLLLDEATSALDIETERALLKNIRSLTGKTCLMVTHRAAALDIADGAFVVKDGKILPQNSTTI